MAFIKTLKFLNGIVTEIDLSNDSLVAKSIKVGGNSGTELTKAALDTLVSGLSEASGLHNHNSIYFSKSEFINSTFGAPDADKPVKSNGSGRISASFLNYSGFASHSNLSNLSSDDHTQYHTDARGDIRYFTKSEFINSSAGSADANKPVKTNSSGKVDSSMVDAGAVDHNSLNGLQGGVSSEYYHLSSSQHSTLTGGSDASSLHNHNTQYYTKSQVDTSLSAKPDSTAVMLLNGTQAMVATMDLGGNRITNLAAPSGSSDAVRKQDLDDLDALVFKKDGSVSATGDFDLDGNKIIGLANPTNDTDAATKGYVDNKITGVSWRQPARTINIVSTSLPTGTGYSHDGIVHVNGDRVLFTSLSSPTANNKVYKLSGVGSSITWAVETDGQAGDGSPTDGDAIYIQEGTTNGDSQWNYNGSAFVQFSGAGQIQAGVGLSKSGNTISANLGAGIAELPTGEIGVDVRSSGGLMLTEDGIMSSTASAAQLAIRLNGSSLDVSSNGLKVSDSGVDTSQIANDAITTEKLSDGSVTSAKLSSSASVDADRAVGTDHIKDSAVTAGKISSNAVDENKLASSVAGSGLSGGAGSALSVNVDNTTIEIASDQLQIKNGAIDRTKIGVNAVGSSEIEFGTGPSQVNASSLPIVDSAGVLSATTVEDALAEIVASQIIRSEMSGEAISVGDLVAIRRDANGYERVFKASAASSGNQQFASRIIQDLTYTSKIYSGNDITINYIKPVSINQPLVVSVVDRAITVYLATDGSAAATSTASDIKSAIEADATANALVSISVSGTGSTIQVSTASLPLLGGMSYNDNGRWEVYGMALESAGSADVFVKVKISGKLMCNFVTVPAFSDIGKSVFLSINSGLASLSVPSAPGDAVVYLGRLVSANAVEFRCTSLRGVLG